MNKDMTDKINNCLTDAIQDLEKKTTDTTDTTSSYFSMIQAYYQKLYDEHNKIYTEWKEHNYKLKECSEDTVRAIRTLYARIKREEKQKANIDRQKFLNTFLEQPLKDIFEKMGFKYTQRSRSFRLEDKRKLLEYLFEQCIKPKLEELGISNVKLKSQATINSYEPFDFTHMQLARDTVEN